MEQPSQKSMWVKMDEEYRPFARNEKWLYIAVLKNKLVMVDTSIQTI